MNASDYQRQAARTECDQRRAVYRMLDSGQDHVEADIHHADLTAIRLNHAIMGLMGEVGELAAALEKWIYYGQDLDLVNVGEEVGDCLWYLSLLLNATGMNMSTIMEANVAKLKARYPEKYSDERAADENRNREAERKTLEEIYPPSLPSYDPQQEHGARQRADEEAALDLLAEKADSADNRASIEIIVRAARVGITTQEIYELPDWQSVVAAIRERQELEGNVGRELEKQVMEDVTSRPVGKEITEALNRHEDPTGQSDALLRIGEVGKSVVAGHSRETAALGVPTPRDPNLEVVKNVDRTKVQDWLCACWNGTSGVHINPPYDLHCGRCGRKRAPAPITYPTEQQFKEEMQARGSPLLRGPVPQVWKCDCGQFNALENKMCLYCCRPRPLEEVPPTKPHPSHEWLEDKPQTNCRKCGAYKHLLSAYLPCRPTAPESAVHEWGEEQGIYQRCKRCGAYRNLASGSMPCPVREFVVQGETASIGTVQSMAAEDAARDSVVTEKVEKEPLEQDGHGWAEPPVSEEEGGRN